MKVRQGTRRTQLGTRARVRPWGDHTGVVQLVLVDQNIVPAPQELAGWIDALVTADGAVHTVRTGALFPDAAARFADAGFAAVDTLALLQLDLSTSGVVPSVAEDRGPARTGSLPVRRHADAAAIDGGAFGSPWANDGDELAEIRAATPRHVARGRYVGSWLERRRLVAFAISGAAAGQGYLQRLAVDPAHQREGHGRALTLDSLRWMRSRRLRAALVNTSVDNEPALALYRSIGFRPRPEHLHVMQLAVQTQP